MKSNIKLVAISGKLGTGKDFIASTHFYPLGFKQISLAWHFKNFLVGQHRLTWEEAFETKPPHVRHMLQQEGTEFGRNKYHDRIWIDTMQAWMETLNYYWGISTFICPDVRFKNELEGLQSLGASIIRIQATKRNLQATEHNPEARLHQSEIDLDDVPLHKFDFVINNDIGNEHNVESQINTFLQDYYPLLLDAKLGVKHFD